MKQEQVIELAKQATIALFPSQKFHNDDYISVSASFPALARFASLVEQATLERAADVVENYDTPDCGGWTALGMAEAIRNLAKDTQ